MQFWVLEKPQIVMKLAAGWIMCFRTNAVCTLCLRILLIHEILVMCLTSISLVRFYMVRIIMHVIFPRLKTLMALFM